MRRAIVCGIVTGDASVSYWSIDLFYRYGGHIELIRFKEYYRIPRGHEQVSFVFSIAFRDIFLNVFLE